MPGWTNVWTMPIQNRVDMLSTGSTRPWGSASSAAIPDQVAAVSGRIAEVVKSSIPGAADVVADPFRGKGTRRGPRRPRSRRRGSG